MGYEEREREAVHLIRGAPAKRPKPAVIDNDDDEP